MLSKLSQALNLPTIFVLVVAVLYGILMLLNGDAFSISLNGILTVPTSENLLGTDELGRDVCSVGMEG